ncbi:hypothetical protein [Paenibacillus paeoniae]|uniref:Copper amine oxidase-like N-terminal domain-containing protein n=1 Tax=Paenibacillus paeoniae TaxID=2292705 RepID=A0A371P658_9BACL|nr:hypothetical protein [Paenibacillus paeoniae]REK71389.1 hypothetical protein DX130_20505 [Paenibacillus paeoniae]
MKLSIQSAILMLLAAATLYGALSSPPAPEHTPVTALALSTSAPSAIHLASTHGSAYQPLLELVDQYDGQLTYNRETDTIDLTVNGSPFSLLLGSGSVLQNSYEYPGDYYTENGLIYMNADQFKKLAAFSMFHS